jgi:RloB-like protein
MTKPNQKNKRGNPLKERFVIDVPLVPQKSKQKLDINQNYRKAEGKPLLKSMLLICEGPTEAAYFEGICDILGFRKDIEITILPEKSEKEEANHSGYEGSSLKGLLYMAMKTQKTAKAPYDEVWIITDNDEGNAYKLDTNSLDKIKNHVPTSIFEKLKNAQIQTMNVRQKDIEKERINELYTFYRPQTIHLS